MAGPPYRGEERAGLDSPAQKREPRFYTYILQSVPHPDQFYRGHTADLKKRLAEHNAGKCLHTLKYIPWKIKFYTAFESLELAQQFEKYLKSGSGHSFSKRHLGL